MSNQILGQDEWTREIVALAGRCLTTTARPRRDQRARLYLQKARSHAGAKAWYRAYEWAMASLAVSLEWETPFPTADLMAGIPMLTANEFAEAWIYPGRIVQ